MKAILSALLFVCASPVFASTSADYIGRETCVDCHKEQGMQWAGSHHDLAMREATAGTVLGNFDGASLTHYGITSQFFRKDNRFMVRTEGPDGKLQDYEIAYTFGVYPLQQYLVSFPDGRLQALPLAWDSRMKEEGGQRWFHLYPDEKLAPGDALHWTGPDQNWNYMCAECHSTELRKNYDQASDTFNTTWFEINVSCEACHGPGSQHVAWARKEPGSEQFSETRGLVARFDERKDVAWTMDPKTGNASRSRPRSTDSEIEVCAQCHSRRSSISQDYVPGNPFMDHYVPSLLVEGLYHADGQIDDEVYVYGSFLQSRMYAAGVTCSDCHEPHSLALRAPGNDVCAQCHLPAKYDRKSHHFHEPGSQGASCAECHMPPKNYMVVDPRHDHSMRIPRPDLSVTLGTPNACNNCHADRDADWAAQQIKAWYGDVLPGYQTYAEALHAARRDAQGAGDALAAVIKSAKTPDIAKATAVAELGPNLSRATFEIFIEALEDESPMVRLAGTRVLDSLPDELRIPLAARRLDDPVRTIRMEAARVLASAPEEALTESQRDSLDRAMEEYRQALMVNAERAESQTSLGDLLVRTGDQAGATQAYLKAVELDPTFIPAYANHADFLRHQGRDDSAEERLRAALEVDSQSAAIHHALGLTLVRRKSLDEAVEHLRLASELSPDDARYVYVYAVALESLGQRGNAIDILTTSHERHPGNRDILSALASFHMKQGDQEKASEYFAKLKALAQ
ncbi:MAG: ammonia-forming cytochrome c nitrite reductase subunit c552 [Gammaproteobacteria bacterium]|jgi:tetratricopeptide (TPR) repeat protein